MLSRKDYTQVSGTSKGVLSLTTDQGRPHLIIGDQAGQLTSFSFDSLSHIWSVSIKPITHTEVQGSTIFTSGGPFVYSFSSSGKELSSFDTNVAENVKTFKVQNQEIWTSGKYLFNHYLKEKELDYLILKDSINDFQVSPILGELVQNPVLACNDKSIRVLSGSLPVYSLSLSSSALSLFPRTSKHFLFGCANGSFGQLQLDREQGTQNWLNSQNSTEVSVVSSCDLLGSGSDQVLVCRTDGMFEVYSQGPGNELSLTVDLALQENITSVLPCAPAGIPEVFVSTYSGKVIAITDKTKNLEFDPSEGLNTEIMQLKLKLESSKKVQGGVKTAGSKVTAKLALVGEQAAYCLTVESQFSMAFLLIQTEVPIEVLDSEDHEATVTTTEDSGQVLVTYKFSDSSITQCQVLFRSSEGQPGTLNIYSIPSLEPKVASLVSIDLKPLSLHEKVHSIDTSDRPLNTIKVTGNFTKSEMHGWISQTLPDVPPSFNEEIVQMNFTHCVIGTVLCISYSAGWAEFNSESVSVLEILKDSLMKLSASRRLQLNINFNEAHESCAHVIRMIEGFCIELQELEDKFQLIEAMKEIEIQGDLEKFGSELTAILQDADGIRTEYKKYPKKLQFFQGMISDLFVDTCKFRGVLGFHEKIPALQNLLANFEAEKLIEFFNS